MKSLAMWAAPIAGAMLWGCGGAPMAPAEIEAKVMAAEPVPPILTQSNFAKDGSGGLTEEQLQEILSKPIDLQFPARVGVVPLLRPFEPSGEVSVGTRSVASRDLAQALIGGPQFQHVSDVSTDLPHVGGVEGLRVLAARYRLRYLLLYSERFVDDTHLNGWAFLYPTLIGMFVAPGVTVESYGLAQVDLLDVRTGTVLFTVIEPMHVQSSELMIGAARAHSEEQGQAASSAAQRLAKRVSAQATRLVAFAEQQEQRKTRILPAPIAPVETTVAPAVVGM